MKRLSLTFVFLACIAAATLSSTATAAPMTTVLADVAPSDDGGCGCAVPGNSGGNRKGGWLLAGAAGVLLLLRRRS